ncbi:MAG: InlB B-repeat-containing protein [Lachnospiraceae bacterium]|nr:InlB B-repeat-containing protein [Lachnospiraceae bacterium]
MFSLTTRDYVVDGWVVEEFQEFVSANTNEYNELYIPAVYKGEPVVGIANSSFMGNTITKITVGYSDSPINIASYAFSSFYGDAVVINRDVTFNDEDFNEEAITSQYIFANSSVNYIVLPDTIEGVVDYMFTNCPHLHDIQFITPENKAKEVEENITADETGIVELPTSESFYYIGRDAFSSLTEIEELNIPNNVAEVAKGAFRGWSFSKNEQMVIIDYDSRDSLPYDEISGIGWNPEWDDGCEEDAIEFNILEEHNIVYHLEHATTDNPETFTRKQSFNLKDAVCDEGYKFIGWYLNPEYNGEIITSVKKGTRSDLELYGRVTPITYSIKYVSNKPEPVLEVIGVMNDSRHQYDTSSRLSVNEYEIFGWHFTEWNTNADGSGVSYANLEQVLNLSSIQGDIISLYAQWERNTYYISYKPNRPNSSDDIKGFMEDSAHLVGIDYKLSQNLYTLTGWHFVGWNTEANGSGLGYSDEQLLTSDLSSSDGAKVNLYAQWERNTYFVEYERNKPSHATHAVLGDDMAKSLHLYDLDSPLTKNQYTLYGWVFTGWNTDIDGSGTRYNDCQDIATLCKYENGTVKLYAQWEPVKYTIYYHPNKPNIPGISVPDVTGYMSISTHTYDSESILSQNNYKLSCFRFICWTATANGTGISYCDKDYILNPTIDKNELHLYANWGRKEFEVHYDKNTTMAYSGVMNNSQHFYYNEEYLRPIGFSIKGWHFIGWNTNFDGSGQTYQDEGKIYLNKAAEGDVLKLYAQWEANSIFVDYYCNAPSNCRYYDPIYTEHIYGAGNVLLECPFEYKGWKFLYWEDGNGNRYSPGDSVDWLGDDYHYNGIALNAVWREKNLDECNNGSGVYEIYFESQLQQLSIHGTQAWEYKLMNDFNLSYWTPVSKFCGTLDLNGHTIMYRKTLASTDEDFAFIIDNYGYIRNGNFDIGIIGVSSEASYNVGGICLNNRGIIEECNVKGGQSYVGYTKTTKNVDVHLASKYVRFGAIACNNYGSIGICKNYASIGGDIRSCGGIAGYYETGNISGCVNYANIYHEQISSGASYYGGIVGIANGELTIGGCANYGTLIYKLQTVYQQLAIVRIAQIAGRALDTVELKNCGLKGNAYVDFDIITAGDTYVKVTKEAVAETVSTGSCVAEGTLITLADGSQVPVESLKGDELLLVWNLHTGTFDVAPIIFIDSDPARIYKVINLYFSDGTSAKVITEHAFWDFDLNKYVYLREDADKYLGHWFNKQITTQDGTMAWTKVQLTDVIITEEHTTAWSPVTYSHLCYYVNGMLSMPGGISGLFNIFEVDSESLKFYEEAMQADIDQYGLFTYEEFCELLPVSEEVFNAFNGQYFKVAFGKGLLTEDDLLVLYNSYSQFLN